MDKQKKSALAGKLGQDIFFGVSADLPRVIEVDLGKLRPNPDQPRTVFKEEALKDLTGSIEQHGLIQPISVVKDPENVDGFIVVAGERRFRAFQRLERTTIPAIITSGNPDEIALIENMQREDLSPLEEAEALAKLMERHRYKQEDLAKVIGKARTTVTELLSLNALPDEIKIECRTSDIASKSVLIEIARLGKREEQLKYWSDLKLPEKRTVRAVRAHKSGKKASHKSGKKASEPVGVPKPKKLFHTKHKASVIVQSENADLSPKRVIGALEEALAQARNL